MSDAFLGVKPRDFSPVAASGLSKEVRQGVNAALESLSTWRNEIAAANEKNGKQVIEQMAAAAKALGWPQQIVDAARTQLQNAADIQVKTMDQMMDVWEKQLKSPNPMSASPSVMLSKFSSLPGLTSTHAATNPLELWMQFAEQWQRAWADMIGLAKRN